MKTRRIGAAAAIAAVMVMLSACGPTATDTAPAPDQSATATSQAVSLQIEDAWVKAAEDGMSAAFGSLVNRSEDDLVIVSATSDHSPIMELHETVENADGQMIMREKDGGFVIPAGSAYPLQPGANHLMLMDITTPALAGDVVEFALEMQDGSIFTFEAPVKDYTGANETYVDE